MAHLPGYNLNWIPTEYTIGFCFLSFCISSFFTEMSDTVLNNQNWACLSSCLGWICGGKVYFLHLVGIFKSGPMSQEQRRSVAMVVWYVYAWNSWKQFPDIFRCPRVRRDGIWLDILFFHEICCSECPFDPPFLLMKIYLML